MLTVVKRILRPLSKIKPLYAFWMMVRARYETKHAFSNDSYPPILIYQMGKVGSTSIFNTLKSSGISNPVLQLHFLSDDLFRYRVNLKKSGVYPPPYHIYLGATVREYINKPYIKPIKIISLVRDPISFIISDLFQNPYFASELIFNKENITDPKIVSEYLISILSRPDTFNYVNEWYDRELNKVFDIDVFSLRFPTDIGYAIYNKNNIDVLLIRLEDLNKNGGYALSKFLNIDKPLTIKQSNIRNQTQESVIYKKVLETISLDRALCENIYSCRFVTHFYSEEMINNFISKWSNISP